MPEAIRDRRPTDADGNRNNEVEYWDGEEWTTCYVGGLIAENPETWWRPIDQTPPPDEKPKRRVWYTQVNKRGELQGKASPRMDFENVKAIEVRPGDPPDLDAALALLSDALYALRLCKSYGNTGELEDGRSVSYFVDDVLARHGEGGEG